MSREVRTMRHVADAVDAVAVRHAAIDAAHLAATRAVDDAARAEGEQIRAAKAAKDE